MPGEVELERLVVRLMGDSTHLERTANAAASKLDKGAKDIESRAKSLESRSAARGAALARSLQDPLERLTRQQTDLKAALDRGLITQQQYGKALTDARVQAGGLTRNLSGAVAQAGNLDFTSPKNTMAGLAGIMGTIPGAFGVIGAAAGGAIAGVIGIGTLLANLFKDKLQARADEAFNTIIDGSKTARQAIAGIKLDVLSDGLKELTTDFRRAEEAMSGAFGGFMRGLELIDMGPTRMMSDSIDDLIERAERAQDMVRRMEQSAGGQRLLRTAARGRAERDLENMREEVDLQRESFGLSEAQLRVARARRDIDRSGGGMAGDLEEAERAARVGEAFAAGSSMVRDLRQQVRDYGITAHEAAAQQLELVGALREAAELRSLERRMESLTLATRLNEQAWQSAHQVWEETRTPMERLEDRMQHLNQLFNTGRLTNETYERSVRAARRELETPVSPGGIQGIAAGSAEFRARAEAQREMLRGYQLPQDVRERIARRESGIAAGTAFGGGGPAPAPGGDGAAAVLSREVPNLSVLLKQILEAIRGGGGGGGPPGGGLS